MQNKMEKAHKILQNLEILKWENIKILKQFKI